MKASHLKNLYQEDLYLVSDPGSSLKKEPVNWSIVVDENWEEYRSLLLKILGSIELGLEQVDIITHVENPDLLEGNVVIAFDPDFSMIDSFYQLKEINESYILKAHTLSELTNDVDLKKKLWSCLKQLQSTFKG